ncbi:dinucleotide-utilizing enzyme possibly involved in molybdopterin or thiamin biosynthesis [Saccharomonospora cyanea NA-134]|uniref:Dinucleotide-utilizing enzyme possibly involved in molybdopterin or thiamin biosynthesis n=2 Tax=Saccharomonospora cyanea TaxID=40989 RepID=H5XKG3_9PSEU|nr:dinucleotide-utilizing enzyme possibly involved in molybdopterin or thiamin biosynthesis [Saccharomonospora cyanea NA-134]
MAITGLDHPSCPHVCHPVDNSVTRCAGYADHGQSERMTGSPPQVAFRVPLPRRPRLRAGLPVVERREGELQIGLDPRHGVIATDLPPILVDVLRGLDGRRSTDTLLSLVRDEHADRLKAVLCGLAERGLVEDAEASADPLGAPMSPSGIAVGYANHSIGVHGGGRLATAVTALLTGAGVARLCLAADGVVARADVGSGFRDEDVGRNRAAALADVARRLDPEVRVSRLRPGATPTDLVVLTDAVVPAPEVVTDLVASGVPHLVARVRDGVGIVGPLVVPGRSSCLRCADLHRTGRDACWPRIAGQLAGRYQEADFTSVYGTAALAVGQTLRALRATPPALAVEPPPTWNATLELDCVTGVVTRREWPPHPRCPCGAPQHRAQH